MKYQSEAPLRRPKILQRTQLAQRSSELHGQGKSIVLTNGCFDLLHVGHTRYLDQAKSLGDVLIVGVNSDRSMRGLKGPDRPINPQDERAEIVAALESVDYVTIFDEPTAAELVRIVCPQVYVKGGDYSEDAASVNFPVEGYDVLRTGGIVRTVPLQEGHSTSLLVEKATRASASCGSES